MYFTGGEPLIDGEHWNLLEELIDTDRSSGITLLYNTNLTTIKYKDKNIIDIWRQFKSVKIQCSIDAVGRPLEYIRSGTDWDKIKSNIDQLLSAVRNSKIKISLNPLLSILNIWFIDTLYDYALLNKIPVNLAILSGPDYLALDVIPDQLKTSALDKIAQLEAQYKIDNSKLIYIKNLINNNSNQHLFRQTLSHVLLTR